MSVTQALTPTQLTVGTGVGTGLMVVEDDFLVLDEVLVVFDGDGMAVESGFVVLVERGFVEVEEDCFVVVDRRVVVVERGVVVAGGDPPVIRFLIARS